MTFAAVNAVYCAAAFKRQKEADEPLLVFEPADPDYKSFEEFF
jgi:hypothetical protein